VEVCIITLVQQKLRMARYSRLRSGQGRNVLDPTSKYAMRELFYAYELKSSTVMGLQAYDIIVVHFASDQVNTVLVGITPK
jgi:hypothetical protein